MRYVLKKFITLQRENIVVDYALPISSQYNKRYRIPSFGNRRASREYETRYIFERNKK